MEKLLQIIRWKVWGELHGNVLDGLGMRTRLGGNDIRTGMYEMGRSRDGDKAAGMRVGSKTK